MKRAVDVAVRRGAGPRRDLVLQIEAGCELAEYLLDRTDVRAPVAGVVVERAARPGQFVREDEGALLFRLSGNGPRSLAQNTVRESKRLALPERLRLVEALAQASGAAQSPGYARLMSFEELAQLAADGHEIGSHSMTHCMMPECDDRALAYEVGESRRVLQARLGVAIDSFCYPNGDCDARSAAAVARAGYRRAVTTAWGHNEPQADPYRLRRCDMDAARMRDADGKLLPAVLAFRMSGFYPGLQSPYPG